MKEAPLFRALKGPQEYTGDITPWEPQRGTPKIRGAPQIGEQKERGKKKKKKVGKDP